VRRDKDQVNKYLNISYVIESTELCGGVRVVFDQSRALKERGHTVLIISFAGDHKWYPYGIEVEYVDSIEAVKDREFDIVVSTFWTTIEKALRLKARGLLHLCQGYEGDTIEYAGIRSHIEKAYQVPIPKIVLGKWLEDRLISVFGMEAFETYIVGQIIDTRLYAPQSYIKRLIKTFTKKRLNVLIVGAFEYSVKAVEDGLKAVSIIRGKGYDVNLIRVSYTKEYPEESNITPINEYYVKITPLEMRDIYYKADIVISPSLSNEGFDLPFAESLACGVPVIATRIPSHMSLDNRADYAAFVSTKDPLAIANALEDLINSPLKRLYLSHRGIQVTRNNFMAHTVAERLEKAFLSTIKQRRLPLNTWARES